jgi:transcriptional regulator with XRE-family HTH domain
MEKQQRLDELADFLRTRRARLRPQDIDFPSGPRRKTPGLRREEVAEKAGISVTWYAWLEQGREVNVSFRTVESIANALKLSPHERTHLFELANHYTPPGPYPIAQNVTDTVRRMLDQLGNMPAYVVDGNWNYVTWNEAATKVFTDFRKLPAGRCNLLWFTFHGEGARKLFRGWDAYAKCVLAQFRGDYILRPSGEVFLRDLVEELNDTDSDFCRWWAEHDVLKRSDWRKAIEHPVAGLLELDALSLEVPDAPGTRIMVYTPAPSTDTAERIEALMKSSRSATKTFEAATVLETFRKPTAQALRKRLTE